MKTPITYYGGKQQLAKYILSFIPPHQTYVEPFFGGGAVFFAKPFFPFYTANKYREVINDKDERVINFYRVCRNLDLFEQLLHKVKHTLYCKETYKEAKEKLKSDDAVEKAWAFFFIINSSFNNDLYAGFANDFIKQKTFINKVERFSKNLYLRLRNVVIEKEDALEIIKKYDTKETFFYIDPPYFNADMGHYGGYTQQDFRDLLDLLTSVQGKFLLSSYESELLSSYNFHTITKKMYLPSSSKRDTKKTEVLSSNFDIKSIII